MKRTFNLKILMFCAALLFSATGMMAQSLTFNQVLLLSSADSLQTVPTNKVWKIENVNGGDGMITVTGASSAHCGTTCTGGTCSSSSCRYVGYIWELNGVNMSEVVGCYNCGGSTCYNNLPGCPANYTYSVTNLPAVNTPFWLRPGNTVKINASNVYFSILEFNTGP